MTENEAKMAKIYELSPALYEALVDGATTKLRTKGITNPTGEQMSAEAVKWLKAVLPHVIAERSN